jgi:tetratricopeptide (TPR) repeat protein
LTSSGNSTRWAASGNRHPIREPGTGTRPRRRNTAKQWYGAAFHLRRLLANDPGNGEYLEGLGAALYRDGKAAEAVEHLTEAVQKHSRGGDIEAQLYLALAHHCLGHTEEARTWLKWAVAQIQQTKDPRPQDQARWQPLRREAEALLEPPLP